MIKVKHYKDSGDFNHDANKMSRDGWSVQSQSQDAGHVSLGRTFWRGIWTLGIGFIFKGFARKGGGITVTWTK